MVPKGPPEALGRILPPPRSRVLEGRSRPDKDPIKTWCQHGLRRSWAGSCPEAGFSKAVPGLIRILLKHDAKIAGVSGGGIVGGVLPVHCEGTII